ncbi:LOB domain-containing protein 4 [Selaginella moellendorffii]|uniref:LOB domain-containing protein 4 n=1 Tax=Selaginella moellendorffii TaxID=88036 RepID=UPI000D1C9EA4|nr:LOB domain-containing protein 4 [Selaginella moellendorffii]|eukprot:XP_024540754.1 LOB domain-containing protein 4 [Selaginella moellendorffii]
MPGAGGMSPCAACKLLRRRCAKDCIFAPFFPPDEPQKFAYVHKVFGASNVNKMLQVRKPLWIDQSRIPSSSLSLSLQDLPVYQRADAVNSMVYEANSRIRDPVYGCVGAISALQQQVAQLQAQLAVSQAEIVCMRMQHASTTIALGQHCKSPSHLSPPAPSSPEINHQNYRPPIGSAAAHDGFSAGSLLEN